jgi:hypothetical protein
LVGCVAIYPLLCGLLSWGEALVLWLTVVTAALSSFWLAPKKGMVLLSELWCSFLELERLPPRGVLAGDHRVTIKQKDKQEK